MKNQTIRILTGHRPTGPRHLGHLVGTLRNWVELQNTHECFFLVADLHVLTTDFEHPGRIQQNTLEVVADWLAAGIDPSRATLVLQSAVPQHAQLNLLFNMLITEARLHRVPTYKEQVQQLHLSPSAGLLTYPVLQAADILLYKAALVPVGEDQLPHVELAREVARRFNQLYGEIFPEPQASLSTQPRLPGLDNRTMHTSYGNAIYLRDSAEETARKIQTLYTDPTRLHASDPGHVENNPLFTYFDAFCTDGEEVAQYKAAYQLGKIGDVVLKRRLAEVVNQALAPLRERRAQIVQRPQDLREILATGSQRARQVASQTLEETTRRMGLSLALELSASATSPAQPVKLPTPPLYNGVYC